jgi:phosphatidate cytidylyltransferase
LVALPVVVTAVVAIPPTIFTALVAVVTALGLREAGAIGDLGSVRFRVLVSAGLLLAFYVFRAGGNGVLAAAVIIATTLLTGVVAVWGAELPEAPVIAGILGTIYVATLFPYFALLRNCPGGKEAFLLMLALVVAGDSSAYFVGRSIGRIKLIPKVSPNKTVEGATASLAASLALAVAWRQWGSLGLNLGTTLALAVGISVMGQVGDLVESSLKRLGKVKDSGWMFPGHGGLLDRVDSLVFAAVFTYYCLC